MTTCQGRLSAGSDLGVDGPVEDGGEEDGEHADHHAHFFHLLRCEPRHAPCSSQIRPQRLASEALGNTGWTSPPTLRTSPAQKCGREVSAALL